MLPAVLPVQSSYLGTSHETMRGFVFGVGDGFGVAGAAVGETGPEVGASEGAAVGSTSIEGAADGLAPATSDGASVGAPDAPGEAVALAVPPLNTPVKASRSAIRTPMTAKIPASRSVLGPLPVVPCAATYRALTAATRSARPCFASAKSMPVLGFT
jgi:hypothetical protein